MTDARPRSRLGWALLGLGILTLGFRLGSAGRLTYHEAIVAQVAREMAARGSWLVPTLGGLPWLEKPPLAFWLVAGLGRLAGAIDETVARLPSVLAAGMLALVVARLAARRCGVTPGLLAGLVQLTTSWAVLRGRLAEVDILLAMLVSGAIAVFEAMREEARTPGISFPRSSTSCTGGRQSVCCLARRRRRQRLPVTVARC
jgi:4-amino-4-deoxy-L-arabinose transferase-like glycosyltransferase